MSGATTVILFLPTMVICSEERAMA